MAQNKEKSTTLQTNRNVNNNQPLELDKTNKELLNLIKFTIKKYIELSQQNNNSQNQNSEEFNYNIFKEVNKIYKIQPKKRHRRIIPECQLCMGRKLDSLQCTRRRLPGKEYCKSHMKKLTNGRIDDPPKKSPTSNKRGRKRKIKIDDRYYNQNYKTFFPCVIKGEKYISDIDNNIFKFVDESKEKIKYLGVLTLEGDIEKRPPNIS